MIRPRIILFPSFPRSQLGTCMVALDLDLHLDSTGQFQLHQSINGLGGRAVNIEQTLIRAQLKLFPRFFIDVRRTQHRENFLVRWQRDRSRNHCAGRFHRLYDFLGGFIHQVVIVRFKFYPNFLAHVYQFRLSLLY